MGNREAATRGIVVPMNICVDCGAPCLGVRCRKDNGRLQALEAARALAVEDAELIRMVADEGLSAERLGARLGISKPGAHKRLTKARKRQALLRAH